LRKTKKNVGNTMKRKEGTNAKNRKCQCGYSETLAAVKKRKQRQDKAEKCLKETERKRKYRNKVKTNSQTTPINDLENSFSNRMQKSRAVQSVRQALPTTPKKRVAVMASYLDKPGRTISEAGTHNNP
jgi:hypothetical protein